MATAVDHSDGGLKARLKRWAPKSEEGAAAVFAVVLGIAAIAVIVLLFGALTGPVPLQRGWTVLLFCAGFALVLGLVGLIAWRLVKIGVTRRAGFAGAKLHTRLVALFSVIAALPAIIVAVFSGIFLFLGIESWFSERQKTVLDNTEMVAQAYFRMSQQLIGGDVREMANELDGSMGFLTYDPRRFSEFLRAGAVQRNLPGAYVITRDGRMLASVETDPNVRFSLPPEETFTAAELGSVQIYYNDANDQVHGLMRLDSLADAYLYVAQFADPGVREHLRATRAARTEYQRAQTHRTVIQLYFFMAYLILALFVLLAAVWLGVLAANRLVGPIGRLIGAAERVSEGDLAVRVDVGQGDDEIGSLARAFNRMTGQLQTQRAELVDANRQLDRRRRFTEAVLSGVSAGVIGLDAHGRITLANRSAAQLLNATREELVGQSFVEVVPEMATLVRFTGGAPDSAQGQIEIVRGGKKRSLTVRAAREPATAETYGTVVTFDDITDLVAAQRMSAWADVARRIAHEIKNPLTPIQLSAERLRRKFRNVVSEPDVFDQCTQTIIRQVSDIGRMVDEFSSFARMPAPAMASDDLSEIVRQAVFLQRVANPDIDFVVEGTDQPVMQVCDRRLVEQALTNVLKNAGEAVGAYRQSLGSAQAGGEQGRIRVGLNLTDDATTIKIEDNGCGLPTANRNQLTEPYVTTRVKGTGLGLAIVKKIMEDHGGSITLDDAPTRGALIRLRFPSAKAGAKQASAPTQETQQSEVEAYGV